MLEISTNEASALEVQPFAGLALKLSPSRGSAHESCHAVPAGPLSGAQDRRHLRA